MTPDQIKNRLRQTLRRHALDVLNERGLVRGLRVEFPRPGACALREFEEGMPGPGEVLLETISSVISPGTERAVYLQLENVAEPYPHIAGYSQVARVLQAGGGSAVQQGQIVSVRAPHASLSLRPAAKTLLVPENVAPDHAALTQIGFIAMQGVRKAAIRPGERVAVLGAGLIGQLAAQLAALCGAEVLLVARSPERLAIARECGVEHTVEARDAAAFEELRADAVLDVTGHPAAFNDALRAAAPEARLILLGSSRGVSENVDLALWQERRVTTIGAHTHTVPQGDPAPRAWTWKQECEAFLQFLARGRLNVEPLITRRAAPAEAPQVYEDLARPDDKSVAVVFDWTQPGPWRSHVRTVSPARLAKKAVLRAAGARRVRPPASLPPRRDRKVLRFGLIGCGEIAVQNAKAILSTGNATISFAADLNVELARGLAAATEAKVTRDLEELLTSPDVDAVLISTPHHLHAPFAIQAARAGKHVVVEKPMATNAADCDRMIEAAREAEVTLSVAYCQRFDPRVQQAARLLKAGVVGEILGSRISFGQYRGPEYWKGGLQGRTSSDWRTRRETAGGGVLLMNACHVVDYMNWLVGSQIAEISSCATTLVQPTEVEDTISLSYRYASGAIGSLDATTTLVGPDLYEQRIWGREGQLIVAPEVRFWSKRTVFGYEAERWNTIRELPRPAERRQYFERFAAAVLDGGAPPVLAEEARDVQAALEGAYIAAERLQPVPLDNDAAEGDDQ